MDRNQQVLASAFRKAKGKRGAIIRHSISPSLKDDKGEITPAAEKLIVKLAKAKALKEGVEYSTLLDGQQWYVEDLIDFSTLNVAEQLEAEYQSAFPSVATEDEMLAALESMAA